jgi:hypothetical protein
MKNMTIIDPFKIGIKVDKSKAFIKDKTVFENYIINRSINNEQTIG